MTPEAVSHLINEALMVAFWLSLPLLTIGFVVGVGVNLLQIITSLQDSSFSTLPRLGGFFAGIVVLLPYMIHKLTTYTAAILGDFGRYAR
jgi:flagellar biosynthesis protein FliQ